MTTQKIINDRIVKGVGCNFPYRFVLFVQRQSFNPFNSSKKFIRKAIVLLTLLISVTTSVFSQQAKPEKQITIVLTLPELQKIYTALGEMKASEVLEIIGKIQYQYNLQMQEPIAKPKTQPLDSSKINSSKKQKP